MPNKPLLALMLFAACGDDDGGGPDAAPDLFEIGTDDGGYRALTPGGTIKAYMGPQGGFHVFLALRANGVSPGSSAEEASDCNVGGAFENPCVDFVVTDPVSETDIDLYVPLRIPLLPRDGAYQTVPARLVQLDIASLDEVDGKTLHFTASVTDKDGIDRNANVEATVAAVR